MPSNTYAGSTLAISAAAIADPAVLANFTGVTDWDEGECALQAVPAIARTWAKVTEPAVCKDTNSKIKGSSMWDDVTFQLSRKPGDAAQAVYRAAEEGRDAVVAFRLTLPGAQGTIYFTAQVSKFAIIDGGGQDDIIVGTVELLVQSAPVLA